MNGFILNISIPRTNPLVLRRVQVRADSQMGILPDIAALALGLQIGDAAMQMDGEHIPVEKELGDLLKPGRTVRLLLNEKDQPAASEPLPVLMDVLQEKDLKQEETLPQVLLALGLNPPQGVTDPCRIHRIHSELLKDGCLTATGTMFTRKGLEFNARRFDGGILRLLDPDNAPQEINMELAVPMSLLLKAQKLPELKDIARYNSVYYYNPIRKDDLIGLIVEHFSNEQLEEKLHDLKAAGYKSFRKLVTSRQLEYEQRIPLLVSSGLMGEVNGRIVFAQ